MFEFFLLKLKTQWKVNIFAKVFTTEKVHLSSLKIRKNIEDWFENEKVIQEIVE